MLILIILALSTFNISARVLYKNNKFFINTNSVSTPYNLFALNWTGSYWMYDGNFFQIDLRYEYPRIAGGNNQVAFFNSRTNTYNSIHVANVYNYSDLRAKENVQTLTTGLNSILNLRPISFKWKSNGNEQAPITFRAEADSSQSSNMAYGPSENNQTQYGFLAQEVEEVLPDAVITDDEGNKMVNYSAMIPMLVQAVQELQATVEAQALMIESLSNGQTLQTRYLNTNNQIISCAPNPTQGYVTITTQLDDNVKSAKLVISSVSGIKEKTINISTTNTMVTEDLSLLDNGIYIVSLFVNDCLVDWQRLIKNN